MRACRQKHIALVDIRRAHLHRTNNPVYTLFQAYLVFASTLGEERMSHTAWTGMLAPALLDSLVEANKVAGLDGAKAHRCLLRQVKLFAMATRDLYRTRYLRMREIRGQSRTTLHLRTPRANTANAQRPGHLLRRLQRTWTYGPSRRASPRAYYSHAPRDGLTTTDWNRRTNLHHAGIGLTHLRGS